MFFLGLSIGHIFDMECKNRNHLGDHVIHDNIYLSITLKFIAINNLIRI